MRARERNNNCMSPLPKFPFPSYFRHYRNISLPLLISSDKHQKSTVSHRRDHPPHQTTGPVIHLQPHQPQRTPAWALLSPSYVSPTGSAHRHPTTSTPTSTNKAPAAGVRAPICLLAALDRCVTGDISFTLALSRRSRISSWPLGIWIERHFSNTSDWRTAEALGHTSLASCKK
ncbi:hypothetical protein CH063_15897, partial [Colletotrichum higginsianum]